MWSYWFSVLLQSPSPKQEPLIRHTLSSAQYWLSGQGVPALQGLKHLPGKSAIMRLIEAHAKSGAQRSRTFGGRKPPQDSFS
jgi:hypothetical protein